MLTGPGQHASTDDSGRSNATPGVSSGARSSAAGNSSPKDDDRHREQEPDAERDRERAAETWRLRLGSGRSRHLGSVSSRGVRRPGRTTRLTPRVSPGCLPL